jgi:hypothetical protein
MTKKFEHYTSLKSVNRVSDFRYHIRESRLKEFQFKHLEFVMKKSLLLFVTCITTGLITYYLDITILNNNPKIDSIVIQVESALNIDKLDPFSKGFALAYFVTIIHSVMQYRRNEDIKQVKQSFLEADQKFIYSADLKKIFNEDENDLN